MAEELGNPRCHPGKARKGRDFAHRREGHR
jgi:hypothetical protein